MVCDLIAKNDLVTMNTGIGCTFQRGDAMSILDLTICSQELSSMLERWEVLVQETLSDHRMIEFARSQKDAGGGGTHSLRKDERTNFSGTWTD